MHHTAYWGLSQKGLDNMKKNLTAKETVFIASMLFGMFFGAGNLIFPAYLGINAGSNLLAAFCGLFITAVGLPLFAVAALGISKTSGVFDLSSKVNTSYGKFFSTLLYLTIGPLFALPRCATTSFSVGAVKLLQNTDEKISLAVFSFVFFAAVLFFALKPSKIMTWIGKILTPVFLISLLILIVTALNNPITSIKDVVPSEAYASSKSAFFSGFLEGYNTLDALAGLAFGIIVVNVVKKQGVEDPEGIAKSTVKAGVFSCLFMGIIYFAITLVSAQSYDICSTLTDGGSALGTIAGHYFGDIGAVLITAIVTLACLKTAVGLFTSCGEAFVEMFPKGPKYKTWAIIFFIVSFAIANFGLSTIVAYCVPVLMFIYPLAITIIILALTSKLWKDKKSVYIWTSAFALLAAVFDFTNTLSGTLQGSGITNTALLDGITSVGEKILPFFDIGLGWILPTAIGFIVGLLIKEKQNKKGD